MKTKLTSAPILANPDFSRDFTLKTDASVHGLGAVLGKYQEDRKLHHTAYASRALSTTEQRYGITEMETLAVVWAVSDFHHYLYGNRVTVFTDHTAVRAVLETSNPSAKHARWWSRVYGRGVREVEIVYRPGRQNKNADALSRQPQLPAPTVGIAEDEVQVYPIVADESKSKDNQSQLTQGKANAGSQVCESLPQSSGVASQPKTVETTQTSVAVQRDELRVASGSTLFQRGP